MRIDKKRGKENHGGKEIGVRMETRRTENNRELSRGEAKMRMMRN